MAFDVTACGDRLYVGIDTGKYHHWAVALDSGGKKRFSMKVPNTEAAITELISAVREEAPQAAWAVDTCGRSTSLLLTILTHSGHQPHYIPSLALRRIARSYPGGERKTDARDATVLAETLRTRPDITQVYRDSPDVDVLRLLISRRWDLMADKVRCSNRLRDLLTSVAPALEKAFDYARVSGALILLTGYQTPGAIRRLGERRLAAWLKRRGAAQSHTVAARAVAAARGQRVTLPGEARAALMVRELAHEILELNRRLKALTREIEVAFREHGDAVIIESMPGFGPLLGAELLASAGTFTRYRNPDALAAAAGLAPVEADSGTIAGRTRRPTQYNRRLRRACFLAATRALRMPGPSQDYYQRKRSEGRSHIAAVFALARRRINVLWAMLRDRTPYTPAPHRIQTAAP